MFGTGISVDESFSIIPAEAAHLWDGTIEVAGCLI